ncbi:MAG: 4'-phosphopantetheinyl transferase superfamily protein [Gammaproteobacteria bacterium]|nr:4'-phosphopantetheinyl transferase superfamily protein [Gammaproteobacteria bacterium]
MLNTSLLLIHHMNQAELAPLDDWLQTLPCDKRDSVLTLKDPALRYRRSIGLRLLQLGMQSIHHQHFDFKDLVYPNDYAKPYLINQFNAWQFNLSHSKDIISCAISQQSIGLDIEYIRQRNYQQFSTYLADSIPDFDKLNLQEFYQHWTALEAVIKAAGTVGLSNLRKVRLSNNLSAEKSALLHKKKWHLHYFSPDENYAGCLASENISEVTIKYINAIWNTSL